MASQFSDLLKCVIPQNHRWKMLLFHKWDGIIGDLKDKVFIEKIQNNVLTLGVSHPAWAQELYFLTDTLKVKINEALSEERIVDIRFKTVVFKKQPKKDQKDKMVKMETIKEDFRKVTLSSKESICLNQVKNDELRAALLTYYAQRYDRFSGHGSKK